MFADFGPFSYNEDIRYIPNFVTTSEESESALVPTFSPRKKFNSQKTKLHASSCGGESNFRLGARGGLL